MSLPDAMPSPIKVSPGRKLLSLPQLSLPVRLSHVVSLYGLSVAQPVYDRYARRPVFFELEGIRTSGMISLAVLISLVLPCLVIFGELLFVRCRPRIQQLVHFGWICVLHLLLALVAAQNLVGSRFSPVAVLGMGLIGGAVLSLSYLAVGGYRRLVGYAVWGNLLFPCVFLYQVTLGNPLSSTDARLNKRIQISRPVPVVLLVFDEVCGLALWTKDRELNRDFVPHFAGLADDGVWYRNATAVHPRTAQALPAILTGNRPEEKFEPQISRYPLNLFTLLLGSRDYEVTAFEPYSFLYPAEFDRKLTGSRPLWEQTFRAGKSIPAVFAHTAIPRVVDLPALPKTWFGIPDEGEEIEIRHFGKMRFDWSAHRSTQMERFIESLHSNSEKVPCYFQHLAIPHIPWCYYPDGSRYQADDGSRFHPLGGLGALREMWCGDSLATELALFRHRMQLAMADRYVGRVVEKLKAIGLYEESLIIVMGDHGVSFQPSRSRRLLDQEFSEDILSIPLVVKYPRSLEEAPPPGTVHDQNVEVIDLLPTIADAIGMTLPERVEGRSLLSSDRAREFKQFSNAGETMRFAEDVISRLDEQPERWRLDFSRGEKFPEDFFPEGPMADLIGKEISELKIGESSELGFKPDRLVLKRSEEGDEIQPGYVNGVIVSESGDPHPARVVVVVNGIVRGTARTIQGLDVVGHLVTFIDPKSFQIGENRLQILETSDGTEFHEVRILEESEQKDERLEIGADQ